MEEGYEEYLLNLLSDGIIRNGEVLAAIFSNLKSRRYEVRDATELEKIEKMYEFIQESRMATHRVSKNSKPYELTFAFLSPLRDFLKNIKGNENFKAIFNDVDSQQSEIKWAYPDKDVLFLFISEVWDKSGKQGDKLTLTRRTLWRYFCDKLECDESVFFEILKKFTSNLGVSNHSNFPFTKEELTEALFQARVGIREEYIKQLTD